MRNNEWLEERLNMIWNSNFSDVKKKNDIEIAFGRKARTRLGSIKQLRTSFLGIGKNENPSKITITGYFNDEEVPEYVVDLTIAHELCHYAHGFSSPLPQIATHPHRGNIVEKELLKRGLGKELEQQKRWIKAEWSKIIKKNRPAKNTHRRKKVKTIFDLIFEI